MIYDKISTSFTYPDSGSGLFKVVRKYFIRDEKMMLPFSIQVHYSFADGVHIGKLADLLQDYPDHLR